jgi:hypothetical protein
VTGVRTAARTLLELAIALASLCLLLAAYFFWLFIPIAGILLYVVVHYAFFRRHRRRVRPLRDLLLADEASARAAEIQRGRGR